MVGDLVGIAFWKLIQSCSYFMFYVHRNALAELTDEELTEKCEGILTKKIRDGDKQAIFQLGQLHFEMVSFGLCICSR